MKKLLNYVANNRRSLAIISILASVFICIGGITILKDQAAPLTKQTAGWELLILVVLGLIGDGQMRTSADESAKFPGINHYSHYTKEDIDELERLNKEEASFEENNDEQECAGGQPPADTSDVFIDESENSPVGATINPDSDISEVEPGPMRNPEMNEPEWLPCTDAQFAPLHAGSAFPPAVPRSSKQLYADAFSFATNGKRPLAEIQAHIRKWGRPIDTFYCLNRVYFIVPGASDSYTVRIPIAGSFVFDAE